MTSLNQRIASLQQQRGAVVTNYERALQSSLDENRDLNDVEQAAIDTLRGDIETIDRQIDNLQRAETLIAPRAAPVLNAVPGDRPGTFVTLTHQGSQPTPVARNMARRDAYKGADFTRMAIAISVAGQWNAVEYARQRWGDEEFCEVIQRAMWLQRAPTPPHSSVEPIPPNLGTPGAGGGALIRLEHLGEEFIEMLRPQMIVSRVPSMRRLQFDAAGTLLIPRQTGGVSGGYVGEGANIMVERLSFGQLRLTPSKLAVIVPTTNEMLHRADPGIEQMIRDDMVEGTARTVDRAWFSLVLPPPFSAAPGGILFGRNELVEGRLPEEDLTVPTPTVNEVTVALRAMIYALRAQNVPMIAPVWIMNPRTKEFLRLQRTTQEIFAWKAEIDAGTLLGYPIIDSTNIPIPFPGLTAPPAGPLDTAYALIDASQLIWAEDMLPQIDASEHAAIVSDTVPPLPGVAPPGNYYSAFQNDMTFMRIRMRHTWARRHDVAVVWSRTGV
jgi:HK97 family phage major capsid protein